MNDNQLQDRVLDILGALAPEVDVHGLKAGVRLRDQLDLDSMDFLNFVIAVDQELGVDIPESEYPRLGSLDAFVAYLAERLAVPAAGR